MGLLFDNKLTFTKHIQRVITKVKTGCLALNRVKNNLRLKERLMVYRSVGESHLLYGLIFWGPLLKKTDLDRLTKLQKRAMRNVSLVRYNAHTDPLFNKDKILKIQDLLKHEQLQWAYKAHKGLVPNSVTDHIVKNCADTAMSLRSKEQKVFPRNSSETSTTVGIQQNWNLLETHYREIDNMLQFKQWTNDLIRKDYTFVCKDPKCPSCWDVYVPQTELDNIIDENMTQNYD